MDTTQYYPQRRMFFVCFFQNGNVSVRVCVCSRSLTHRSRVHKQNTRIACHKYIKYSRTKGTTKCGVAIEYSVGSSSIFFLSNSLTRTKANGLTLMFARYYVVYVYDVEILCRLAAKGKYNFLLITPYDA